MSTLILLSLFVVSCAASLFLDTLFLRWGVRWFAGLRIGFGLALLNVLLAGLGGCMLVLAALLLMPDEARTKLTVSAVAVAAGIIVPVALTSAILRVGPVRSFLAWRPTNTSCWAIIHRTPMTLGSGATACHVQHQGASCHPGPRRLAFHRK